MPPCVGIVWAVADGSGPLLLITDLTPLAEAEPYGDFLTHPHGHHEVWEGWRRLGPAGLARRGLPALIAWHEYEHFPRGRVVFDTITDRFTLYSDRRLQPPAVLRRPPSSTRMEQKQILIRLQRCVRSSSPLYSRAIRGHPGWFTVKMLLSL